MSEIAEPVSKGFSTIKIYVARKIPSESSLSMLSMSTSVFDFPRFRSTHLLQPPNPSVMSRQLKSKLT